MSAITLPVEESFATGRHDKTLVLLVCAGWIWAGLYAGATATPSEVSATPHRTVTTRRGSLQLGAGRYAMSTRSLQRAARWLSRQGITVREA
ncbi:conserved hypothetical protein [uncultured Stenotrophomonas sp.]|uniref:Uncharacterized protein n=1 Tax=uncultured Stenotrophomonas sp. TaxID=165438 RepID=A0A1Y5QCB5_9GAMM|nr:conserved hypothetical protein [uncultured Stenotrophomonas sp.]